MVLFIAIGFYAYAAHAISIGGSIRGSGFGVGASSDGSVRASGSKGPVSGSVHVDASSDESSSSGSSSGAGSQDSMSSSGTALAGKPVFNISQAELPKYKGKTPKMYARQNGALIYTDIIFLYYNKENNLIEFKVVEKDGTVLHSAGRHKDLVFKMPKGTCEMKDGEFICPQ